MYKTLCKCASKPHYSFHKKVNQRSMPKPFLRKPPFITYSDTFAFAVQSNFYALYCCTTHNVLLIIYNSAKYIIT